MHLIRDLFEDDVKLVLSYNEYMIKMIFFDIDGTLVPFQTAQIPEDTCLALKKLQANGIKCYIATGRHHLNMENIANFKFDGYITLNGQYVYNEHQVIYKNHLHQVDVWAVCDYLKTHPLSVKFIGEDFSVCNCIDQSVTQATNYMKQKSPFTASLETIRNQEVLQMVFYSQKETLTQLLTHSKAIAWWSFSVDVVPKSASKLVGIKKVCEYENIDISECMAFGDGDNDIEMLAGVGIGIAMGNASQTLQAVSDEVCEPIEEKGLIKALQRHHLI